MRIFVVAHSFRSLGLADTVVNHVTIGICYNYRHICDESAAS